MAALALALFALYFALAFGARAILQLRRTGSSGFKGVGGRLGSVEWFGGALFVRALGLGLAAPVLDLVGAVEPVDLLDGRAGHALGLVLYGMGLVGTLVAQGTMGRSWRIGVDESEKTELVITGPFAIVRNPIFAAMIPGFLGLTLMVPNIVALAGFLALVGALELQVRFVEEPYLLRTHGEGYAMYASRVGRFAPGLGKLKACPGERPSTRRLGGSNSGRQKALGKHKRIGQKAKVDSAVGPFKGCKRVVQRLLWLRG